jgi:acetyltransferase
MRDGTEITIRPIRPEDEPLMVKFHATLSDRTVYMRYFNSISLTTRTTHERLMRICHSDDQNEMVLIADLKDQHTRETHILGVARLNKLHAEGGAEIAVLVADQHQRKGLGTELLRRLVKIARDMGVNRLLAEMLRDNVAIQTIFRGLGFRLRLLRDPGYVQAILEL